MAQAIFKEFESIQSKEMLSRFANEKLFLLRDLSERLVEFKAWCEEPHADLISAERLTEELLREVKTCSQLLQDIELLDCPHNRSNLSERIRLLYRMASGVLVSADWQSPAIASSLVDQCGRYPELIEDYTNDYKRHFHYLAKRYEQSLQRELIVSLPDSYIGAALVTSCGMSAGSTLFEYLRTSLAGTEKILVDEFVYHETRFLLDRIFPQRCIFCDAADTGAFQLAIDEHSPALVVIDSFRNTHDLSILDLEAILSTRGAANSTFVIDNSCLGPAMNIPKLLHHTKGNQPHIFHVESLIKLHHFGMDLANSGFIAAYLPRPKQSEDQKRLNDDLKRLSLFRTHFGTHISDTSVASLPSPNFQQTRARLDCIGRNSRQMHRQLAYGVEFFKLQEKIQLGFPRCQTKALELPTPYFAFKFLENEYDSAFNYAFVAHLIKEARQRNISLVNGTAFGFDVTRLYYVESTVETLKPFLRISPGTETPEEITAISKLILEVAKDFLHK